MIDPIEHMPEGAKSLVDAGAFLTFIMHALGVALPHVLTALTIVWLSLRIWESATVSRIVAGIKARRWRKHYTDKD